MNINEIDFDELYRQQKLASTFKPKTMQEWDEKAFAMNRSIHQSIYNEQFLSLVDTKGCTSLLDIGCGPGNLALRFAKKLENVYALDYSAKMLECLQENMRAKNIQNIKTLRLSWDDDWTDVPPCDIVVASRSMEVSKMKEALQKLHDKAKKAVYLSYKVGGSFLDPKLSSAVGLHISPKPDYIYIVNILYQMGITAQVEFIESENRQSSFDTFDALLQSVSWSVGELGCAQEEALRIFFEEGKHKELKTDSNRWAVISWGK